MLIAEANMALDYRVLKMSRFRPPMDVGRVSSKLQFSKLRKPEKSFPGQGDPGIHSQCWAWGDVDRADSPEVHGQVAVGNNPSQYEICFAEMCKQSTNFKKRWINCWLQIVLSGKKWINTHQPIKQSGQPRYTRGREIVFPIWNRLMWPRNTKYLANANCHHQHRQNPRS